MIDRSAEDLIGRDLQYWDRVAEDYDKSLTNRYTAEEGSILYQQFEEDYIEQTIEDEAKKGKIILIELGCGTGRILKKYANDPRVEYLIGIDFSEKMIECLFKNFECVKELIGEKIIIVQDLAENAFLSFNKNDGFKNTIPIAICMFNTLGNIEYEERRIEVLKRIKEMIGINGIGIISVFNRALMEMDITGTVECDRYYTDERIEKLIVPPQLSKKYVKKIITPIFKKNHKVSLHELGLLSIDKQTGDIRTDDFYSHWFDKEELQNIIKISGLKVIDFIEGNKVNNFRAKRGIVAKVGRDK